MKSTMQAEKAAAQELDMQLEEIIGLTATEEGTWKEQFGLRLGAAEPPREKRSVAALALGILSVYLAGVATAGVAGAWAPSDQAPAPAPPPALAAVSVPAATLWAATALAEAPAPTAPPVTTPVTTPAAAFAEAPAPAAPPATAAESAAAAAAAAGAAAPAPAAAFASIPVAPPATAPSSAEAAAPVPAAALATTSPATSTEPATAATTAPEPAQRVAPVQRERHQPEPIQMTTLPTPQNALAAGGLPEWYDPWIEDLMAGRAPFSADAAACAGAETRRRRSRGRLLTEAPPPARLALRGSGVEPFPGGEALPSGESALDEFSEVPPAWLRWLARHGGDDASDVSDVAAGSEEDADRRLSDGPSAGRVGSSEALEPKGARRLNATEEQIRGMVTSWRCVLADGSQVKRKRRACEFWNLYHGTKGPNTQYWRAHFLEGYSKVDDSTGPPATEKEIILTIGTQSGFVDQTVTVGIVRHRNLESLLKAVGTPTEHVELHEEFTLVTHPVYHFNYGHGVWDGLYPSFVSIVQLGLVEEPFRVYAPVKWNRECENQIPGSHARVEHIFGLIGGLGCVNASGMDERPEGPELNEAPTRDHKFSHVVLGRGTDGQKLDSNGNFSLGGCRDLDACRAFRSVVFKNLGLPQPPPARTSGPFRVIVIQNVRYNVAPLVEQLQNHPGLKDFDIEYVAWSKPKPGKKEVKGQTGNFADHMRIISATDIHVSGPGTGQMYQSFLPDGAVHINLGDTRIYPGYMEEYMAEGAPYLRALYYRTVHPNGDPYGRFDVTDMVDLLLQAKKLLEKGFQEPTPVGANLSPVGHVWKAYNYFAHREEFGLKNLSRDLIPWRDIWDETSLGNRFLEDPGFIYAGLPSFPKEADLDVCLLKALRSSYDAYFPKAWGGSKPWFGSDGSGH